MSARRLGAASKLRTHPFTLFIEGLDVSSDAHVDALHEAGCDDATFGARDGAAYAIFDREAVSFGVAVRSAMADILRALPQARIVRVEPDDLVTMATIAKRCGRTRESIRLLANDDRGPGGFPPPVAYVDDRTRLWRWRDVASWLNEHQKAKLELDTEAADLVASLNAAFDLRDHAGRLQPGERAWIDEILADGPLHRAAALIQDGDLNLITPEELQEQPSPRRPTGWSFDRDLI